MPPPPPVADDSVIPQPAPPAGLGAGAGAEPTSGRQRSPRQPRMSLSSLFRRGPFRFGVLIAFTILAAALARLAELPTGWILGVIAIAWVLAALIERSAHRAAAIAMTAPAAAVPASGAVGRATASEAGGTRAAIAPVEPEVALAPPPVAPARPRAAAPREDELCLEDDAVIDPAPAPAVHPAQQPAPPPGQALAVGADEPERGAVAEQASAPEQASEPEPVSEPEPALDPEPEPDLVLPPPPRPPSSSSLPRGIWNLWEAPTWRCQVY